MKKTHIIIIILIAVSIGAIFTTLSDSSTYATFTEAFSQPEEKFHVVGKLSREKEMNYNPEKDANIFTFYMHDNNGIEKKVVLHKSKPQDFERSEQIVIIGKAIGDEFHANEILMKCPSKYTDGTPETTTTASSNK